MVDQNKFADNFFALINDFQVNQNRREDSIKSKGKEQGRQNEKDKRPEKDEENKKYENNRSQKANRNPSRLLGEKRKDMEDNNSKMKNKKVKLTHSDCVNDEITLHTINRNNGLKKGRDTRGNKKSSVSPENEITKRNEYEAKENILSNINLTKGKPFTMDCESLKDLLNSETDCILKKLGNPTSGYLELLNNHPSSSDLLMVIIKLLHKIRESEAYQLKNQVYSTTLQPKFIDDLKKVFSSSCIEEDKEILKTISTSFTEILSVLGIAVNSFPSIINYRLKSLLNVLKLSMSSIRDDHNIHVDDCLFDQLAGLVDQVHSHIEHNFKVDNTQKLSDTKNVSPPCDYKSLSLVPTKEDFSTDRVFLRQNIVKGSYNNVDHYLDVQFRLLREDFIAPLREGIFEYIDSISSLQPRRKYSNVRIYPKVKFLNSTENRFTQLFNVQFDSVKTLVRRINWDYNKRFMNGSLLLITDDNFQSFFLATVVGRNIKQLEKGVVSVTFVQGTKVPENLFRVDFVMAESEVYYEAYMHVLSALQKLTEDNFPMKKYIVEADTVSSIPAYLKKEPELVISSMKVNLLENDSWPTAEELKLNFTQHQALKSALTNEFSVIQGPPGTGKTFLALKIAEILLTNRVSKKRPILVICYTNHALDQFLEQILKYTPHIVRIGMQSTNETLQKHNIEEMKKQSKQKKWDPDTSWEIRKQKRTLDDTVKKLSNLKARIEDLGKPEGILESKVLKSVITPKKYNQYVNFESYWLCGYDDPKLFSKEDQSASPEEINEFPLSKDYSNEFQLSIVYSGFKYKVNIEYLEEKIKEMKKTCKYRKREHKKSYHRSDIFYSNESIEILEFDLNFIKKNLKKLRDFKFNPNKYHTLEEKDNIWELCEDDRWEYYFSWLHLYKLQLEQEAEKLSIMHLENKEKLHELRQLQDGVFVKDAAVVGITTSGAAKRRVLLECLRPKIVIVEEAAEVLEAHIVTSLVKTVKHVILIGDHKQLKPKPSVYKLAKEYNMECSLFERMINNKLPCVVLNEQHRMRPEIASLITPVIYPELMNHPCTLGRPKVRGVDKFLFFLTHNHAEDQLLDSTSKHNKHEADLLMELCKYLLLNDYKPEEITILATYIGQVWYMKKKRREMGLSYPDLRAVRISAVDNFQGEENRIILLSLVRSNKENKIGFLSTENRVCVALSRAREGLYVVGNMDNLTNSSSIWPKIKQQLLDINAIGPRLILRCERHPEQFTQVGKAEDFQAVPMGGCLKMCDAVLRCGHKCPTMCHNIGQDHEAYNCVEKCKRRLCQVEEHKDVCLLQCWQECSPCNVRTEKQLSCGHTAHLRCSFDPVQYNCIKQVKLPHPDCGHEISKLCYHSVEKYGCTKPCKIRLPCGHACTMTCHVKNDPDHLRFDCMKECTKEFGGCARQLHACHHPCFEECKPCTVLLKTTLPCGHDEVVPCNTDTATFTCVNYPCEKTMTCGHKCRSSCGLPCDPRLCSELVKKQAPCGHLMIMKCKSSPKDRECIQPCLRTLACGHPCTIKCFEDCSKVQCQELVDSPVSPACGHPAFKIPCHLNKPGLQRDSDELLQLCRHLCGQLMDCGHRCTGSCGACMQGRLHIPCNQQCARVLLCGHKCGGKCWMLCPPCYKPCTIKCQHGKCFGRTRVNHPCFENCMKTCDKRCTWKCQHYRCSRTCGEQCDRPPCNEPCRKVLRCGHPCIGYCGETCPPLCATCDADDPAIRSNPSARYVLLEDCKHVIEGTLFDSLTTIPTENNVFCLMRCPIPTCSAIIVNTDRCKSTYLGFRKQVVKINTIVKEEEVIRLEKRQRRCSVLLASEPTSSSTMNSLMTLCSQKALPRVNSKDFEMGKLILASLLEPLAVRCNEIIFEKEERLRHRLEYLAKVLLPILSQIGYQTILQTERMVAQILKMTRNNESLSSWYDTSPTSPCYPTAEQAEASTEDDSSAAEQAEASTEDDSPAAEQTEASTEDDSPAAEQAEASTEDDSPAAEQAEASTEDDSPAAEQAEASTEDDSPAAEQVEASTKDDSLAAEQAEASTEDDPLFVKLSSTLRTRDSAKQWFLCVRQHLYVKENKELCPTCQEKWLDYEQQVEMFNLLQNEHGHSYYPDYRHASRVRFNPIRTRRSDLHLTFEDVMSKGNGSYPRRYNPQLNRGRYRPRGISKPRWRGKWW